MPRVWWTLNRFLPLEDFIKGAAALWTWLKLGRRRNRELTGRAWEWVNSGVGRSGVGLTGDGRRSWVGSARGSEKSGDGGSGSGSRVSQGKAVGEGLGLGPVTRWRLEQEEMLRAAKEKLAREDRFGVAEESTRKLSSGSGV
jgi:hypothetical protein